MVESVEKYRYNLFQFFYPRVEFPEAKLCSRSNLFQESEIR